MFVSPLRSNRQLTTIRKYGYVIRTRKVISQNPRIKGVPPVPVQIVKEMTYFQLNQLRGGKLELNAKLEGCRFIDSSERLVRFVVALPLMYQRLRLSRIEDHVRLLRE